MNVHSLSNPALNVPEKRACAQALLNDVHYADASVARVVATTNRGDRPEACRRGYFLRIWLLPLRDATQRAQVALVRRTRRKDPESVAR